MTKKKLLLDREAFIDWFFDYDMCKSFVGDYGVFMALITDGKFTLKATDLIANCGFIPEGVVAEGQEPILNDSGEVDICQYDVITFAKTIKQKA
jgi:hypothetical protein